MRLTHSRRLLIRRAARKMREWQEERDRQIAEAITEGASLREVAMEADLTHQGVNLIAQRSQGQQ